MGEGVRCKFRCMSVTEHVGWGDHPTLFSAKFQAVSRPEGSENRRFWDATPSGIFAMSTVKEMPFRVCEEYYFDITLAS